MRRLVSMTVALATVLVAVGAVPAAAGQSGGPVTVSVTLDGQNIAGRTVPIDPSQSVDLALTVDNNTDNVQQVHSVRLSGTALGLTFFDYDTTVPFEVPAHGRVSRELTLDLSDLDGQAIGLLPTSVAVLDAQRGVVARADTVADVRGSIGSVYGVFGIVVFVLTVLAWGAALLALARHRLPRNRWRRAMRFLPAGFGTGVVAVVTLSVLRVVAPAPAVELPVIAVTTVVALVLGYLTPHPVPPVDDRTIRIGSDLTTEGIRG